MHKKNMVFKKGAIEFDELAKLILAGILLVVIIILIFSYIGPEYNNQLDKIKAIFSFF